MIYLHSGAVVAQYEGRSCNSIHCCKRLNAGLSRKLTLVSAPSGFGKTTLVSEWVAGLRSDGVNEGQTACAIAWLSLDEGDHALTRFLAQVIAALRTLALSADGTSGVEGVG
jgi:ATP/maltotriose-dependent transcriptional regulator MalT